MFMTISTEKTELKDLQTFCTQGRKKSTARANKRRHNIRSIQKRNDVSLIKKLINYLIFDL